MKKIFASMLVLAALAGGVISTSAAPNKNNNQTFTTEYAATAPALQRGMYRQRTVRYVTRYIRQGRHLYRATYQVINNRNGRTTVRLVSRVRVR